MPEVGTDSERQWEKWWNALPIDHRELIEGIEFQIGARMTWNQRYMDLGAYLRSKSLPTS